MARRINGPLEKLLCERGLRRAVVQTHCPTVPRVAADFFVQFAAEVQRVRDSAAGTKTELPDEPELLHEAVLRARRSALPLHHPGEEACKFPYRELARERRAVVPSVFERGRDHHRDRSKRFSDHVARDAQQILHRLRPERVGFRLRDESPETPLTVVPLR